MNYSHHHHHHNDYKKAIAYILMAEIIGFSRPPFSSIFFMAHLLFGTSAILPWEAMFLHFHINFAALSDAFAHQYFFQSSAILHCAQHHQPSCLIGTDTGI